MSAHGGGELLPKQLTLTHWVHYFGGTYNVSDPLIAIIVYVGLMGVLWTMIPNLPLFILLWGIGLAPIWVPATLLITGTWVFFHANRAQFVSGNATTAVLLELKLPKSLLKTPRAMEAVYTVLDHNGGETTMFDRAWTGSTRPWWSIEIVSIGGNIHYYLWTWKRFRNLAEAAFYGQYPELEIVEVEDYALKFYYDHNKYKCFAGDQMKMPAGTRKPIRTYVDWDLDNEMRKEENRVDPYSQVLEVLSAAKPHEQIWLQMVFRPADGKSPDYVDWNIPWVAPTEDYGSEWINLLNDHVQKIRLQAAQEPGHKEGEKEKIGFPHPTWIQTLAIQNLERNMVKHMFQVIIRSIYISDITKGSFDGTLFTAVRWIFKPFNSGTKHKYFAYIRSRYWHNPFDFSWQDFWDYRWNHVTHHYLDAYKRRSGFAPPHIMTGGSEDPASPTKITMILSTEEMATLFRFPHDTIKSPGLNRVEVKTSLPPSNLPK